MVIFWVIIHLLDALLNSQKLLRAMMKRKVRGCEGYSRTCGAWALKYLLPVFLSYPIPYTPTAHPKFHRNYDEEAKEEIQR